MYHRKRKISGHHKYLYIVNDSIIYFRDMQKFAIHLSIFSAPSSDIWKKKQTDYNGLLEECAQKKNLSACKFLYLYILYRYMLAYEISILINKNKNQNRICFMDSKRQKIIINKSIRADTYPSTKSKTLN